MRGLDAFSDVLDLVRNADKYEEKVKQLTSLLKQIQDASGGAAALAKAKELETAAERVLASAREEAAKIVADAKDSAARMQENLAVKEAELRQRKSEVNDLAFKSKLAQEDATKAQEKVAKDAAEVETQRKNLEVALLRLAEKEAQVNERLEKLRSVMQ